MPAPSEASPEGSTLFDKSAFDQTRNLCGVQVEAKQVGRYVALLKGYARAVHTTPHPLSPSNAPPPAPQLPLRRQKGPLRRRLSARAPLGRRQQRQARPLQRGDRQGYQAPRCCSPTADLSELPEDIRKQLEGLSVVEYTVTTGYNEMSAGIPLHPLASPFQRRLHVLTLRLQAPRTRCFCSLSKNFARPHNTLLFCHISLCTRLLIVKSK